MLEQSLIELGLTPGEAKVYLALRQTGESTVGAIIKRSKVASSKIYNILDRLLEKGLVSYIAREKTRYFAAVQPARFNEFLDKKEQNLQAQRANLQKILPALEQLPNTNLAQHDAAVFIGFSGIKTAYEELFANARHAETIKFFFIHDSAYDAHVYKFYFQTNFFGLAKKYNKEKKIRWEGIINKQRPTLINVKKSLPYFRQHYTAQAIPGNIDISRNHVLITAWSDKPVGILIRSKEVADNLSDYFEKMLPTTKKIR